MRLIKKKLSNKKSRKNSNSNKMIRKTKSRIILSLKNRNSKKLKLRNKEKWLEPIRIGCYLLSLTILKIFLRIKNNYKIVKRWYSHSND